MATITSVATGIYSIGTTWSGGVAPGAGDDVIIDGGYQVTVAGAAAAAATLIVKSGTLVIGAQTVTVGGNCLVATAGRGTKIGSATLVVGGNLEVRKGSGTFMVASTLTVAGRTRIAGRTLEPGFPICRHHRDDCTEISAGFRD